MEKKSKITKSAFQREWSGPNGVLYYHDIELDNGDKGSIGSKEKMPLKLAPGSELTYTMDTPGKIKAVNPAAAGGGFQGGKGPNPKVQIVGFAMAYTKDLVVADKIKIEHLPAMFEKIHGLMAAKL